MGKDQTAEPMDINLAGQQLLEPIPEPGPPQSEDPNQSQIEPEPTPHGQEEPKVDQAKPPPPPPIPHKVTGKLKPSKVTLDTDDIVEYRGGYRGGFRIDMPAPPPPRKPRIKQTARKAHNKKRPQEKRLRTPSRRDLARGPGEVQAKQ